MLAFLILLPVILAEPFWMTAGLLRVDWRDGCLTTAGCSQPRFKIFEDMLPVAEKISISWPISEHFVQDVSRPFVSHWAKGEPEDLALSCQVVGTDPTYGFPRVCDQTATIRVFQKGVAEAIGWKRRHQDMSTTAMPGEELGKKLIEIRAKCFNATIGVQKHTERCPWCPDPSDVTVIEQRLPEDNPAPSTSILSQLKGDEKLLHVTHQNIPLKSRYQPYSPACKAAENENRYDMPWEQTRPLAHKLSPSSKSEAATTSPLDSVSSLRGSPPVIPHGFQSGCTIPQTNLYQHTSPIPP